ncbi:MAG: pilus assembly protein N-terminal domain-containing protein [Planctomycetota bacterium]
MFSGNDPRSTKRRRHAKRAGLMMLIAAASGTALTGEATEPTRSSISLTGGRVRLNPFVSAGDDGVSAQTAQAYGPVVQASDVHFSEVRLKTIGTAVGLLPIDQPAESEPPVIHRVSNAESVKSESASAASPLEDSGPVEFSFSDSPAASPIQTADPAGDNNGATESNSLADLIGVAELPEMPKDAFEVPLEPFKLPESTRDGEAIETASLPELPLPVASINPIVMATPLAEDRLAEESNRSQDTAPDNGADAVKAGPVPATKAAILPRAARPWLPLSIAEGGHRVAVKVAATPMVVRSKQQSHEPTVLLTEPNSPSPADGVAGFSEPSMVIDGATPTSMSKPVAAETMIVSTASASRASDANVEIPSSNRFRCRTSDVVTLSLPGPILSVTIADPSVCRVVDVTSRHMRIAACSVGSTVLEITTSSDGVDSADDDAEVTKHLYQCEAYEDRVESSRSTDSNDALMRLIERQFPTARIQVRSHGDRLVVVGECDTNDDARAIIKLIRKSKLVRVDDRLTIR